MSRPLIASLVLRRPDVCTLLGFSNSTLHRLMACGDFPQPRKLGDRSVAWLRSECEAWLGARPTSDILPPSSIVARMQAAADAKVAA